MKRFLCAFVAVCCFLQDLSLYALTPSGATALNVTEPRPELSLSLPGALGTLHQQFRSSDPSKPIVFHLQTLHGSPEANRRVGEIIHYLRSNYGAELVFAEGASGPLRPEYLRWHPDPEKSRKVTEEFIERGYLTGAEIALEDGGIRVLGIEQAGLYRAGYKILQRMFRAKKEWLADADLARRLLDKQATRTLPKKTLELLEVSKRYQAGDMPLEKLLGALRQGALEVLDFDLLDLASQIDWPNLYQALLMFEAERRIDSQALSQEAEALKRWASDQRVPLSDAFMTLFSDDSPATRETPRKLTELFLTQAAPHDFGFKDYPNLHAQLIFKTMESEVDVKALSLEIRAFLKKLMKSSVSSDAELGLLSRYELLDVTRKAGALELDAAELKTLADTSIRHQALELFPAGKRAGVRRHLETGLVFYRLMALRERRFFSAIKQRVPTGTKVVVLVTGGFHAEGMEQLLRQGNFSYAALWPRIAHEIPKDLYTQMMLEQAQMEQILWLQSARDYWRQGGSPEARYKAMRRGMQAAGVARPAPLSHQGQGGIASFAGRETAALTFRETPRSGRPNGSGGAPTTARNAMSSTAVLAGSRSELRSEAVDPGVLLPLLKENRALALSGHPIGLTSNADVTLDSRGGRWSFIYNATQNGLSILKMILSSDSSHHIHPILPLPKAGRGSPSGYAANFTQSVLDAAARTESETQADITQVMYELKPLIAENDPRIKDLMSAHLIPAAKNRLEKMKSAQEAKRADVPVSEQDREKLMKYIREVREKQKKAHQIARRLKGEAQKYIYKSQGEQGEFEAITREGALHVFESLEKQFQDYPWAAAELPTALGIIRNYREEISIVMVAESLEASARMAAKIEYYPIPLDLSPAVVERFYYRLLTEVLLEELALEEREGAQIPEQNWDETVYWFYSAMETVQRVRELAHIEMFRNVILGNIKTLPDKISELPLWGLGVLAFDEQGEVTGFLPSGGQNNYENLKVSFPVSEFRRQLGDIPGAAVLYPVFGTSPPERQGYPNALQVLSFVEDAVSFQGWIRDDLRVLLGTVDDEGRLRLFKPRKKIAIDSKLHGFVIELSDIQNLFKGTFFSLPEPDRTAVKNATVMLRISEQQYLARKEQEFFLSRRDGFEMLVRGLLRDVPNLESADQDRIFEAWRKLYAARIGTFKKRKNHELAEIVMDMRFMLLPLQAMVLETVTARRSFFEEYFEALTVPGLTGDAALNVVRTLDPRVESEIRANVNKFAGKENLSEGEKAVLLSYALEKMDLRQGHGHARLKEAWRTVKADLEAAARAAEKGREALAAFERQASVVRLETGATQKLKAAMDAIPSDELKKQAAQASADAALRLAQELRDASEGQSGTGGWAAEAVAMLEWAIALDAAFLTGRNYDTLSAARESLENQNQIALAMQSLREALSAGGEWNARFQMLTGEPSLNLRVWPPAEAQAYRTLLARLADTLLQEIEQSFPERLDRLLNEEIPPQELDDLNTGMSRLPRLLEFTKDSGRAAELLKNYESLKRYLEIRSRVMAAIRENTFSALEIDEFVSVIGQGLGTQASAELSQSGLRIRNALSELAMSYARAISREFLEFAEDEILKSLDADAFQEWLDWHALMLPLGEMLPDAKTTIDEMTAARNRALTKRFLVGGGDVLVLSRGDSSVRIEVQSIDPDARNWLGTINITGKVLFLESSTTLAGLKAGQRLSELLAPAFTPGAAAAPSNANVRASISAASQEKPILFAVDLPSNLMRPLASLGNSEAGAQADLLTLQQSAAVQVRVSEAAFDRDGAVALEVDLGKGWSLSVSENPKRLSQRMLRRQEEGKQTQALIEQERERARVRQMSEEQRFDAWDQEMEQKQRGQSPLGTGHAGEVTDPAPESAPGSPPSQEDSDNLILSELEALQKSAEDLTKAKDDVQSGLDGEDDTARLWGLYLNKRFQMRLDDLVNRRDDVFMKWYEARAHGLAESLRQQTGILKGFLENGKPPVLSETSAPGLENALGRAVEAYEAYRAFNENTFERLRDFWEDEQSFWNFALEGGVSQDIDAFLETHGALQTGMNEFSEAREKRRLSENLRAAAEVKIGALRTKSQLASRLAEQITENPLTVELVAKAEQSLRDLRSAFEAFEGELNDVYGGSEVWSDQAEFLQEFAEPHRRQIDEAGQSENDLTVAVAAGLIAELSEATGVDMAELTPEPGGGRGGLTAEDLEGLRPQELQRMKDLVGAVVQFLRLNGGADGYGDLFEKHFQKPVIEKMQALYLGKLQLRQNQTLVIRERSSGRLFKIRYQGAWEHGALFEVTLPTDALPFLGRDTMNDYKSGWAFAGTINKVKSSASESRKRNERERKLVFRMGLSMRGGLDALYRMLVFHDAEGFDALERKTAHEIQQKRGQKPDGIIQEFYNNAPLKMQALDAAGLIRLEDLDLTKYEVTLDEDKPSEVSESDEQPRVPLKDARIEIITGTNSDGAVGAVQGVLKQLIGENVLTAGNTEAPIVLSVVANPWDRSSSRSADERKKKNSGARVFEWRLSEKTLAEILVPAEWDTNNSVQLSQREERVLRGVKSHAIVGEFIALNTVAEFKDRSEPLSPEGAALVRLPGIPVRPPVSPQQRNQWKTQMVQLLKDTIDRLKIQKQMGEEAVKGQELTAAGTPESGPVRRIQGQVRVRHAVSGGVSRLVVSIDGKSLRDDTEAALNAVEFTEEQTEALATEQLESDAVAALMRRYQVDFDTAVELARRSARVLTSNEITELMDAGLTPEQIQEVQSAVKVKRLDVREILSGLKSDRDLRTIFESAEALLTESPPIAENPLKLGDWVSLSFEDLSGLEYRVRVLEVKGTEITAEMPFPFSKNFVTDDSRVTIVSGGEPQFRTLRVNQAHGRRELVFEGLSQSGKTDVRMGDEDGVVIYLDGDEQKKYKAVVLEIKEGQLITSVPRGLEEKDLSRVRSVRVVREFNDTIYRVQIEKLQGILDAVEQGKIEETAAYVAVGAAAEETQDESARTEWIVLSNERIRGDREQLEMIARAINGRALEIGLGPFGTGKSTTGAEINYQNQLRQPGGGFTAQIVAAQTHAAVDSLLLLLKKSGVRVIRVGNDPEKIHPDLREDWIFAARESDPSSWKKGIREKLQNGNTVIGGTMIGLANDPFLAELTAEREGRPKLKIVSGFIDESSVGDVGEMLTVLSMIEGRAMMIGDIHQLGVSPLEDEVKRYLMGEVPGPSGKKTPTVWSRERVERQGVSLFEQLYRSGYFSLSMLKKNYRNTPLMVALANPIYGGALQAVRQVPEDVNRASLVVVDMSVFGHEDNREGMSVYNEDELKVALWAFEKIAVELGLSLDQMGLITPYAAQHRRFRQALVQKISRQYPGESNREKRKELIQRLARLVGTVYPFQGAERIGIFNSTVRRDQPQKNARGVLTASTGYVGRNMMNVMNTRGQEFLIVFINSETYLNARDPDIREYSERLMKLAERQGTLLKPDSETHTLPGLDKWLDVMKPWIFRPEVGHPRKEPLFKGRTAAIPSSAADPVGVRSELRFETLPWGRPLEAGTVKSLLNAAGPSGSSPRWITGFYLRSFAPEDRNFASIVRAEKLRQSLAWGGDDQQTAQQKIEALSSVSLDGAQTANSFGDALNSQQPVLLQLTAEAVEEADLRALQARLASLPAGSHVILYQNRLRSEGADIGRMIPQNVTFRRRSLGGVLKVRDLMDDRGAVLRSSPDLAGHEVLILGDEQPLADASQGTTQDGLGLVLQIKSDLLKHEAAGYRPLLRAAAVGEAIAFAKLKREIRDPLLKGGYLEFSAGVYSLHFDLMLQMRRDLLLARSA